MRPLISPRCPYLPAPHLPASPGIPRYSAISRRIPWAWHPAVSRHISPRIPRKVVQTRDERARSSEVSETSIYQHFWGQPNDTVKGSWDVSMKSPKGATLSNQQTLTAAAPSPPPWTPSALGLSPPPPSPPTRHLHAATTLGLATATPATESRERSLPSILLGARTRRSTLAARARRRVPSAVTRRPAPPPQPPASPTRTYGSALRPTRPHLWRKR